MVNYVEAHEKVCELLEKTAQQLAKAAQIIANLEGNPDEFLEYLREIGYEDLANKVVGLRPKRK